MTADWREKAACHGSPELFFPPECERPAEKEDRVRDAKELCSWCPVRKKCLDVAVSEGLKFGIWGGMDEDERALELRRRQRREREHAA